MSNNTVYLDVDNGVARAAVTGLNLPSVRATLLTRLAIIARFFSGAAVQEIDADTAKCVIKAKDAPSDAPALIDTSALLVGTGEESAYYFEWTSADSVQLRAILDAAAEQWKAIELRAEIEYELDGELNRIAFPIYFNTAYNRPDDPAPDATAAASLTWLSAHAIRFDAAQSLTAAQTAQALSNAGLTGIKSASITRGTLRLVLSDDSIAHTPLISGEPPDL